MCAMVIDGRACHSYAAQDSAPGPIQDYGAGPRRSPAAGCTVHPILGLASTPEFLDTGSELGLSRADYGTHSMRRTKATLIYRRTKNLRAVQLLLGHSKLESTVRYLGIEVDDALEISEQTEI